MIIQTVEAIALLWQLCGAMLPDRCSPSPLFSADFSRSKVSVEKPTQFDTGTPSRVPEPEESPQTLIINPIPPNELTVSVSEVKAMTEDESWIRVTTLCPLHRKMYDCVGVGEEGQGQFDSYVKVFTSILRELRSGYSERKSNPILKCEGTGLTLRYATPPAAHFACEFEWIGGNRMVRPFTVSGGKKRRQTLYRSRELVRISECSDFLLLAKKFSLRGSQYLVYLVPEPSIYTEDLLPYYVWTFLEKELENHSCDLTQFLSHHTTQRNVTIEAPMLRYMHASLHGLGVPPYGGTINFFPGVEGAPDSSVFSETETGILNLNVPHIFFLYDSDASTILFVHHYNEEHGLVTSDRSQLTLFQRAREFLWR